MDTTVVHHAHRPIGHPDIIDVILDICKAEQEYGTILLTALISKHHNAIVRPHLKRLKSRIVLNLEDFVWRDKDNDRNIEIILCDRNSPVPVPHTAEERVDNADVELETADPPSKWADLHSRLKPTTIIFRGRPWVTACNLWLEIFPSVTLVVFNEDGRCLADDVAEYSGAIGGPSLAAVDRFHRIFENMVDITCDNPAWADKPHVVRHRLHQGYQQYAIDRPGQRLHQVRFGDLESDVWLCDSSFQQSDIVNECKAVAAARPLFTGGLRMDSYVQLPEIAAGAFFAAEDAPDGPMPSGFVELSKMVERLTTETLADSADRFTFRLYILQHGTKYEAREDMEPIYSTTCSVTEEDGTKTAVVMDREWDEDFADCVKNGGCNRCGMARAE